MGVPKSFNMKLLLLVAGSAVTEVFAEDVPAAAPEVAGEDRGKGHDHGDDDGKYNDPHATFDVDPGYIWKYVQDNSDKSCMKQCLNLQAMNVNPHQAQIFCYDAKSHGWNPESPKWELRMEIRCQEGHWVDRMPEHRRKRDADGEDADDEGEDRGKGHGHGHNHGSAFGDPHIMAYGHDGNEWSYKPRWFYCNDGEWITKQSKLDLLPNAYDMKTQAGCAHAHGPPDYRNGCDVEHYDWGSGQYYCRFKGDHDHGPNQWYDMDDHAMEKPKMKAEMDENGDYNDGSVRSEDEAQDRWGNHVNYYKKVCRIDCAWPSIPRRLLFNGRAAEITCDIKSNTWMKGEGPEGCDEPYGRGHQCVAPITDNGHWTCHGPQSKYTPHHHNHGHVYVGSGAVGHGGTYVGHGHDHKYDHGHGHGHGHGYNHGHGHTSHTHGHTHHNPGHLHRRSANETEDANDAEEDRGAVYHGHGHNHGPHHTHTVVTHSHSSAAASSSSSSSHSHTVTTAHKPYGHHHHGLPHGPWGHHHGHGHGHHHGHGHGHHHGHGHGYNHGHGHGHNHGHHHHVYGPLQVPIQHYHHTYHQHVKPHPASHYHKPDYHHHLNGNHHHYVAHHDHGHGFYTELHEPNSCVLTCDPGYVSSTCDYHYNCDPTQWPSWSPRVQPPLCVPEGMQNCDPESNKNKNKDKNNNNSGNKYTPSSNDKDKNKDKNKNKDDDDKDNGGNPYAPSNPDKHGSSGHDHGCDKKCQKKKRKEEKKKNGGDKKAKKEAKKSKES